MNLSQRTSLSLLFVSLSSIPATAALSGDAGSGGASIESSSPTSAHQSFDQLLGGGNNANLFESIMQKHAKAADPAKSIMDGHFEGDGSTQPAGLPSQVASPFSESGQSPNLSLSVAAHQGAQGESNPASATSPSSTPPSAKVVAKNMIGISSEPVSQAFTTTVTSNSPVPLPAAGLLLASGLFGMAGMRKRTQSE
jgi:hypothetical protein